MVLLKGWRFVAFVSCFVGGIGLALYPIIIDPMLNTGKYKAEQEKSRAGLRKEDDLLGRR